MMTKKEEQKQMADLKKKQMDEDAFMEAILEQKKQLILEAIKSRFRRTRLAKRNRS